VLKNKTNTLILRKESFRHFRGEGIDFGMREEVQISFRYIESWVTLSTSTFRCFGSNLMSELLEAGQGQDQLLYVQ